MRKDTGIPDDMVPIEPTKTEYASPFWKYLLGLDPVQLGEFLIDRYEVSNHQFQVFVDAGGYENPKFWEDLEFSRDGDKVLAWEDAMNHFRDATGRPGPATWRNGSFPPGRQEHPVCGVSWFEAAAFARFAGKSLPTIHHWQWAADTDQPEKRIAPEQLYKTRDLRPRGTSGDWPIRSL